MEARPSVSRALIVTGLCRSGGAAVAEVCHHLGYCMARTLDAPVAPDFRLDFEDAPLTKLMAENVEEGLDPSNRIGFRTFIRSRQDHSVRMGFGGDIGFKSPLFSIGAAVEKLEEALEDEGCEPFVIRMERDRAAIERSIARQPGAAVMRRWNALIDSCEILRADLVIPYEVLVGEPSRVVGILAQSIEIDDPDLITRAAGRVLQPCS
jgi:hypothetical protein